MTDVGRIHLCERRERGERGERGRERRERAPRCVSSESPRVSPSTSYLLWLQACENFLPLRGARRKAFGWRKIEGKGRRFWNLKSHVPFSDVSLRCWHVRTSFRMQKYVFVMHFRVNLVELRAEFSWGLRCAHCYRGSAPRQSPAPGTEIAGFRRGAPGGPERGRQPPGNRNGPDFVAL